MEAFAVCQHTATKIWTDPSVIGEPQCFIVLSSLSAVLTFQLLLLCTTQFTSKAEDYHQDVSSQNISARYTERKNRTRAATLMARQRQNYLTKGQTNKQMWQLNQELTSFYNLLLMLQTWNRTCIYLLDFKMKQIKGWAIILLLHFHQYKMDTVIPYRSNTAIFIQIIKTCKQHYACADSFL